MCVGGERAGGGFRCKRQDLCWCAGGAAEPGPLSRVCPLQEDYRRTVTEIDEKEYISLRLIISELRNQYVSETPELALAPCTAAGRALCSCCSPPPRERP